MTRTTTALALGALMADVAVPADRVDSAMNLPDAPDRSASNGPLAGLTPGQHVLTFGGTNPDLPVPSCVMTIVITAVAQNRSLVR